MQVGVLLSVCISVEQDACCEVLWLYFVMVIASTERDVDTFKYMEG